MISKYAKQLEKLVNKLESSNARYREALEHILNPLENDERKWDNYRSFAVGIAKEALESGGERKDLT